MQAIDWHLFQFVNGLAGHVDLADDFFSASANLIEYVLLLVVATLWITPADTRTATYNRRAVVVYAVVAALLALGVNQLISAAWFRPRPFAHHDVTLLLSHSTDASFPSDHAAGGFALAVIVWQAHDRWLRRLGWLMLALGVLLCFARVYSGVHYPGDVIAGAIVGSGVALIVWRARPLLDPALAPVLRPLDRFTDAVLDRVKLSHWEIAAS
jgi:undecaprenyl-diphosphatase